MKTYKTDSLDFSALTDDESHLVYNGLDCTVTHRLLSVLKPQLKVEDTGRTYDFYMACAAPALTMMRRGIRIDESARAPLLQECESKLAMLGGLAKDDKGKTYVADEEAYFQRLAKAVGGAPVNYNSRPQLIKLFYDQLNVPRLYKIENGQRTVSIDREALEKIASGYLYPEPLARALLAIRKYEKERQVLCYGIDPDGRFRYSISPVGTETGRWSSKTNIFGRGCLPGDAEVLTPSGWKRIDECAAGEIVMQWDRGILSWTTSKLIRTVSDKLLCCSTEQYFTAVTPEHRIPFWTWKTKESEERLTASANILRGVSQAYVPLSGSYSGGNYNPENPRLLVAALADGSYDGKLVRWSFKKQRKAKRLVSLCNIAYKTKPKEGYAGRFSRVKPESWPKDKRWGSWVLDLSVDAANQMLDEIEYWDGHRRKDSVLFFTADKEQAGWVATLAHLHGRSATVTAHEQSENSWSDTIMYHVNIKPRDYAHIMSKHWSTHFWELPVYCLSVPSTYFLVRQHGKISVTGNSNIQNITDRLRRIFIADEGYVLIYADLQSAESYAVGYLANDQEYIAACRSGDLHTYVARLIWPDLPWTGDLKADRRIADQPYYLWFTYRDMAKRAGHASNYIATPQTLSRRLKISQKVARDFQEVYFTTFPGIPVWQESVIAQVQMHGYITTPLGMRRAFWGRLNDAATHREAIAHTPQSLVGMLLAYGLLNIHNNLEPEVQMLAQAHDAVLAQIPREALDELAPKVVSSLELPIHMGESGVMTVPADAKYGMNWAEHSKDNPNGLRKKFQ